LNERFLRRISADLHDGPAQLLALASLRLGEGTGNDPGEVARIRSTLDEAMQEIRDICRGLTLPKIDAMDFNEILRAAVQAHENATDTRVELVAPREVPVLTNAQKICIFRFVQEGLSNAYRHAGGVGQKIVGEVSGANVTVEVSDAGSGFDVDSIRDEGLGLAGLRERVESLGGDFNAESSASGTRLIMTLLCGEEEVR
jgi:signal transduction histidine kinase